MDQIDERLWSRRDCVSADVEGSLVLLDLDKLVYHSLNSTAAAVWNALETPASVSSVSAILLKRFQVEHEHCRASVQHLLQELESLHLVHAEPAPIPQSIQKPSSQFVGQ